MVSQICYIMSSMIKRNPHSKRWKRLLIPAVLLVLLFGCVSKREEEKQRVMKEALEKTEVWFAAHMENTSVKGCDMVYEKKLCSAVKGEFVVRNYIGTGKEFTDHTYAYVYDYENDRMYDSRMSQLFSSCMNTIYQDGLGLNNAMLIGKNLDNAIPYILYEDNEGNPAEIRKVLYQAVYPSDLTEETILAYAEEFSRTRSGERTGLVFQTDVERMEDLNLDFLKTHPGVHAILIEGNTCNWEILTEVSASGEVRVHAKKTVILDETTTEWDF